MKVVFVVLHYCQVNVTLECIKSLLGLKGVKEVVVVDNASPDGSGAKLKNIFINNDMVHVILNDSNLGFASANNIGYAYSKKELKADVIVVLNNDTVIKDDCFVEKLLSSPLLQKYHIIAPNIINKEGKHQNPLMLKPRPYKEICNIYRHLGFLKIIYSIPIIGDIKAKNSFSYKKRPTVNSDREQEMIVPHGAAIIYTPLWIKKEDFAFYPGTFMYVEESILYYYIMNHDYRIVYTPKLEVYHLEDVSTNTRFKKKRKKALFQARQIRKSYKVLMSYIEQNSLFNL